MVDLLQKQYTIVVPFNGLGYAPPDTDASNAFPAEPPL
jgi:hypothetical protein